LPLADSTALIIDEGLWYQQVNSTDWGSGLFTGAHTGTPTSGWTLHLITFNSSLTFSLHPLTSPVG